MDIKFKRAYSQKNADRGCHLLVIFIKKKNTRI